MGKLIYMESTINMMGKQNGKKTKQIVIEFTEEE